MAKGILGKKLGMTQVFDGSGKALAVTVIEAGPNVVLQRKTAETDGYGAVQLGFDDMKERRATKPMRGHFGKNGVKPKKFVRELRAVDAAPGTELKVDVFQPGDHVDVIGTSKGKGFAGGVKRHNFNRGPMSHGSMYHRRPGASGPTDPARVFKGRLLPGRMGHARVTAQNLTVVRVDADRNLLLVHGAVPGIRGAYVIVRESKKAPAAAKKS